MINIVKYHKIKFIIPKIPLIVNTIVFIINANIGTRPSICNNIFYVYIYLQSPLLMKLYIKH